MEATPINKGYSGRVFDAAALEQVRGIPRAHAGASRQQLSYRVCEALDWRKPVGSLKDMSCRVALLRLYREGLIELPAPRRCFEPLASKLLGLAARTLPAHWQAGYGYRPLLLETFVEAQRCNATCYQAANWVCVGETQGRGKLGDHRLGQVPVKTVWLYPLVADCRARLCR